MASRRANFRIRSVLQASPSLLPAEAAYSATMARLRGVRQRDQRDLARAQLLLDGCQGSGNTYLAAALQISLGDRFRLAHHLHSASMSLAAGRAGIPCVIVVREPSACAVSIASKFPYVRPRDALRHWIRYHTALLRHGSEYQFVSFVDVAQDVNVVVAAIGTWLDDVPTGRPLCEEALLQLRRHSDGNSPRSAVRLARKRQLAIAIEQDQLESLRSRATAIYQQILDSPNWLVPPLST